MLNTQNSQPTGDIFREWRQRRAEASDRKTKTVTQQDQEFLMSLRNDNTHADEAVVLIRILLYTIMAFIVYLSAMYYLRAFEETFHPFVAVIFAIGLPVCVEIGTFALGRKALRAFMFGWYRKSWSSFFYWSIIAVMSVGFFAWSYYISTQGIAEVARDNAKGKHTPTPLSEQIKAATADVDAQIASLDANDATASGMKTKRGRVNWTGSQIMQNNSQSRTTLQDQRAAIVKQVTDEYNTTRGEVSTKADVWATFVQRFGGYGELIKFVAMLAVAFFERRLYQHNLELFNTPPQSTPQPKPHTQAAGGHRMDATDTSAYNRTAGFHRLDQQGNVPTAHSRTQTVVQPVQTVVQPGTSVGADEVLNLLKAKLQVEIANFRNEQARKSTVSGRINTALNNAYNVIRRPDFVPSQMVAIQTYDYLQDVFKHLNSIGWPYLQHEAFSKCLRQRIEALPNQSSITV